MSLFTRPSPLSSTSDTPPLSSGSATCCDPNCFCRTVSSVGSTTPRLARVQLNPYEQRETHESPSISLSNGDLLRESDAPTSDACKQDFDFDDVFNYDHNGDSSATSSDDNDASVSQTRPKIPTHFSFSHYTGHIKGAGNVKMTRPKSGHLRPRVARTKTACQRPGCGQCH